MAFLLKVAVEPSISSYSRGMHHEHPVQLTACRSRVFHAAIKHKKRRTATLIDHTSSQTPLTLLCGSKDLPDNCPIVTHPSFASVPTRPPLNFPRNDEEGLHQAPAELMSPASVNAAHQDSLPMSRSSPSACCHSAEMLMMLIIAA